ncbi:MAG TPA: TraR/DksA family transcriptional regulator [Acidimicrobiales bacterium]|jgi:DnaK suppressor protein
METELPQDDGPEEVLDGDRDDPASEAHDLQRSEDSIDAVDELLDEVEGALSRLDDGTYGVCQSCGASIDDARLAESPTAQSCADCQSASAA